MGKILWGRGWGKNILDKGNKVSKTSEKKKRLYGLLTESK